MKDNQKPYLEIHKVGGILYKSPHTKKCYNFQKFLFNRIKVPILQVVKEV